MNRKREIFCFVVVLCGALLAPLAPAEETFEGKTIEWIIPFREGGGSDTWARFNAPFLSKYLPGEPQVIVTNDPGGSSTKAVNRYAVAADDSGLSLLGTSASTQFPYLLGDSRVRYDYADWQVLMVYPTGGVVYVRPELGIESAAGLRDLGDRRLTFGSLGATSLDLVPMLGFELLGLNVAPIFGIRGRSAGLLAFQRGDATIDFQTSAAYLRNVVPLVAEGKAIPLFTLGSLNENGDLVRDPQFPELPHFGEVYEMLHGDSPNGIEWESWFAFYSAGFGAQKLLVIPRDTPDEIVATYRTALEAMRDDPDYIEQKPAALGAYTQVTGEAAERLYNLGTNVPDEARRWIKKWLRSRYKLRI